MESPRTGAPSWKFARRLTAAEFKSSEWARGTWTGCAPVGCTKVSVFKPVLWATSPKKTEGADTLDQMVPFLFGSFWRGFRTPWTSGPSFALPTSWVLTEWPLAFATAALCLRWSAKPVLVPWRCLTCTAMKTWRRCCGGRPRRAGMSSARWELTLKSRWFRSPDARTSKWANPHCCCWGAKALGCPEGCCPYAKPSLASPPEESCTPVSTPSMSLSLRASCCTPCWAPDTPPRVTAVLNVCILTERNG